MNSIPFLFWHQLKQNMKSFFQHQKLQFYFATQLICLPEWQYLSQISYPTVFRPEMTSTWCSAPLFSSRLNRCFTDVGTQLQTDVHQQESSLFITAVAVLCGSNHSTIESRTGIYFIMHTEYADMFWSNNTKNNKVYLV